MRLKYAATIFALVAVLVLVIIRTGEVQLVTVALIVALAAALLRAGPQLV